MNLDRESCYKAALSRDHRFDGRFFIGVTSTGIYCRPICPARTPKQSNMKFFTCAAAAEEAGFRACRRCRPESAPGTPAWLGTSVTVARALRLISEGVLDECNLDLLAERVGIGERHLRRLFNEELGASPCAVAQTRRIHFAAKLLEETDLPVGEVAFGAGFRSIRRFNDVMKKSFGKSPSSLRQLMDKHQQQSESGKLCLKIPFRPPYDWQQVTGFLQPRAIPGVEVISPESYQRTFVIENSAGILEVKPAPGKNWLYLLIPPIDTRFLRVIVERVRRLFDCNADPLRISEQLRQDAKLAPTINRFAGLRVPGAFNNFEIAVRAILGQQITVQGATTLSGRLVQAFGKQIYSEHTSQLTHLFPTAEVLAAADLSQIGLPQARAHTILALAKAAIEAPTLLEGSSSLDETIKTLTKIKGIGNWTAQYIAMRVLGEPDAFPASDLALRKALSTGDTLISVKEIEQQAEPWRPWRAYAAMFLWSGLAKGV
jgi:AraC family transcriptional regulator, regulatory protein of adaptative response / DNA-3-methyladenine glycosylase II